MRIKKPPIAKVREPRIKTISKSPKSTNIKPKDMEHLDRTGHSKPKDYSYE